MDKRIGSKFLHPGPGYGGSCFPKDTRAIVEVARDHGVELEIVGAVIGVKLEEVEPLAGRLRAAHGFAARAAVCKRSRPAGAAI